MAEPRDRQFFALSSAVVKGGLAFIERWLAAKPVIQPYDNWPVITWSQGMPDFSFTCANPPIDYTDAFNSLWSMVAMFVGGIDTQERFDFDKHQPYQELKRYIRSEPHFASHVFPPDLHEDVFDSAIRSFSAARH